MDGADPAARSRQEDASNQHFYLDAREKILESAAQGVVHGRGPFVAQLDCQLVRPIYSKVGSFRSHTGLD